MSKATAKSFKKRKIEKGEGLAVNHRKRRIPPNWTAKVVLEPKSRGQSYTLFNDFEVVSFGITNLKFLLLLNLISCPLVSGSLFSHPQSVKKNHMNV